MEAALAAVKLNRVFPSASVSSTLLPASTGSVRDSVRYSCAESSEMASSMLPSAVTVPPLRIISSVASMPLSALWALALAKTVPPLMTR